MKTVKEIMSMKNFKKHLLILAGAGLLVVFGCGVTGCNDHDNNGAVSNTPAPVVTPPTPDDSGLPPDPGEAGKATLEGIDSNNNKVRDDMEIAIYKRYPNDELKRDALMRDAFVLQKAMLAGGAILNGSGSQDEVFRISPLVILSSGCDLKRFGYDGYKENGFIESILVNTDDRGRAYDMYNATLSGSTVGLPDTDTPCQDINF
jgi:hypothetical protein